MRRSHFETVADDVLAVYKQVTGEHLDLHVNRDEDDELTIPTEESA